MIRRRLLEKARRMERRSKMRRYRKIWMNALKAQGGFVRSMRKLGNAMREVAAIVRRDSEIQKYMRECAKPIRPLDKLGAQGDSSPGSELERGNEAT